MTLTPADGADRAVPSRGAPRPSLELAISEHDDGQRYAVRLAGDVDLAALADLRQVTRRYRESAAVDVVLDMAGVDFMDSAGLSWVVHLHPVSRAKRGRIVLRDVAPSVWRVFDLTGIARLVTRVDPAG